MTIFANISDGRNTYVTWKSKRTSNERYIRFILLNQCSEMIIL